MRDGADAWAREAALCDHAARSSMRLNSACFAFGPREQGQAKALYELREELYKLKHSSKPSSLQTPVSCAVAFIAAANAGLPTSACPADRVSSFSRSSPQPGAGCRA
jgi:hypothetical protein